MQPLGLIAVLVGLAGSPEESSPPATQPLGRTIVVSSGRCPGLTEVEAQTDAEAEASKRLAAALQELARQFAGVSLSSPQALNEWTWLASQPGVKQDVKRTCQARDYGWVAEHEVSLFIPPHVLGQWATRLVNQASLRWQARLIGALGTILVSGAGLTLMIAIDRWTRGYYRALVVCGVMGGLVTVIAFLWLWILTAY
ncbi:MAG: hypothetical protein NZ899_05625 [Thermoguttaceae bacterium]|nr:hypothetical protein [Thermoguttaceae bacterium]MDW8079420.1 hypothetical protein [Thermoguttaceae bacterium]